MLTLHEARYEIYGSRYTPPLNVPPRYIPSMNVLPRSRSGLQLASLALGSRTLVGTGLRQRHISRKSRQRCFHAYFSWGECSGRETTGVEPSGGNFPGGIFRSPIYQTTTSFYLKKDMELISNRIFSSEKYEKFR